AVRDETPKSLPARKRTAKKPKREPGRWVREAKGILALALAGFSLVALGSFDPKLHPLDQSSAAGPVGAWPGAGSFWAVGYAGYLFPLLLALYGISAFVRTRIAASWHALVGLVLLLLSLTGILARASDTLAPIRIHKGGVVGWGVAEALSMSVGSVGTWSILLALLPVGVLCVTQSPYSVVSRALGLALSRRLRRAETAKAVPAAAPGTIAEPQALPEPLAKPAPPQLVVKEPARPKSGLAE